MEPGRSLERCSDMRLVQCGAEVSGLDPIVYVGMLGPGTSPPGRLPRLTSARADIDNNCEQHQPKDPMRLTSGIHELMSVDSIEKSR